jgi:LuxR family transcriptional regulator
MSSWRENCLHRFASAAGSSAVLLDELAAIVADLGFEYCAYVLTIPFSTAKPDVIWSCTYPTQWLEYYLRNEYYDSDPLLQQALRDFRPVAWTESAFDTHPQFWEGARAFGVRHGWTLATHGKFMTTGILALARSQQPVTSSELADKEMKLVWLSHLIHGLLTTAEAKMLSPESAYQLTEREREVLRWSAVGKTADDIGRILGISERTVTFHITSSLSKLDVINKTQAVAKALLLELL